MSIRISSFGFSYCYILLISLILLLPAGALASTTSITGPRTITFAYSRATLLSGSLTDCLNDPRSSWCEAGYATCSLFVRNWTVEGKDVLWIPNADRQAPFVQMHPDTWGVNGPIMDYFNRSIYFTTHSFFTSPRPGLALMRSVNTTARPLLVNVETSTTDEWYGVPLLYYVYHGIAMLSTGHVDQPNSADAIASSIVALKKIKEDSSVWATVIWFSTETYTTEQFCEELAAALIENPDLPHPALIIDRWRSMSLQVLSGFTVIGNNWRDDDLTTVEATFPGLHQTAVNITTEDTSIEDLTDAQKDTQYWADINWLNTHAQVAATNDPLSGYSLEFPPARPSTGLRPCQMHECPQGNLFTDAMRWKAGADIAFTGSGGVRGSGWDAGPVKISNIWSTLPFANRLCHRRMLGLSVWALINRSTAIATFSPERGTGADRLFQISGARYTVNTQITTGTRVISIDVLNKESNEYEPLDRLKLYQIATDDFVCNAFDNYPELLTPKLEGEVSLDGDLETDEPVQNHVHAFLQAVHPTEDQRYDSSYQGRITNNSNSLEVMSWTQTSETCIGDTLWDPAVATCRPCPPDHYQPTPGALSCTLIVPESKIGMILSIILPIVFVLFLIVILFIVWSTWKKGANLRNAPDSSPCSIIMVSVFKHAALWDIHASEMPQVMQKYRSAVRKMAREHGVYEVKRVGDSNFLLAASNPHKATAFAIAINSYVANAPWSRLSSVAAGNYAQGGGAGGEHSDSRSVRSSQASSAHRRSPQASRAPSDRRLSRRGSESPASQGRSNATTGAAAADLSRFSTVIGLQHGVCTVDHDLEHRTYDYSGATVTDAAMCADLGVAWQIIVGEGLYESINEHNHHTASVKKGGGSAATKYQQFEFRSLCPWALSNGREQTLYQIDADNCPSVDNIPSKKKQRSANNEASALAALDQETIGLAAKRITVLHVNVDGPTIPISSSMDRATTIADIQALHSDLESVIAMHKGHVQVSSSGNFTITFNAYENVANQLRRALLLAFDLKALLENSNSRKNRLGGESSQDWIMHAGLVSGQALVGNLGGAKTKGSVVYSPLIQQAQALAGMCAQHKTESSNPEKKDSDTSPSSSSVTTILAPSFMKEDLDTCAFYQYVDFAILPFRPNKRCGLLSISSLKDDAGEDDEWMYELEAMAGSDPFMFTNQAFEAFLNGDVEGLKKAIAHRERTAATLLSERKATPPTPTGDGGALLPDTIGYEAIQRIFFTHCKQDLRIMSNYVRDQGEFYHSLFSHVNPDENYALAMSVSGAHFNGSPLLKKEVEKQKEIRGAERPGSAPAIEDNGSSSAGVLSPVEQDVAPPEAVYQPGE